MKKLAIALSVAAGVSGLALSNTALANPSTATGDAYGRIRIAVLNITPVASNVLDFGEVMASGVAGLGTVVVAPDGSDTTTGGVQSGTFTPSQGLFDVSGNRDSATYGVSFPNSPVTLSCATVCTGADPVVDTFTFDSATGGGTPALDATGLDVLSIGATLNFDPQTNDGEWAGTYDVEVVYN